jgi:hypothetical protein
MLKITFALCAISPRAYQFIRELLPFSSEATIAEFIQSESKVLRHCLTDFPQTGLAELLSGYRQREGLSEAEPVNRTLAFDATSVSSTGVLQNESRGQSCFVFMILPLDHRLSDLLIRSIPPITGRIDSQVLRIKSDLVHILTELGLCVDLSPPMVTMT